jgi:hypothetical protein
MRCILPAVVTARHQPRPTTPFLGSSTVEQAAVNRKVRGSNPLRGAIPTSSPRPKIRFAPGFFAIILAYHPRLSRHPSTTYGRHVTRMRIAFACDLSQICTHPSQHWHAPCCTIGPIPFCPVLGSPCDSAGVSSPRLRRCRLFLSSTSDHLIVPAPHTPVTSRM